MASFAHLTPDQARAMLEQSEQESPVIADIRDSRSFASGHIVGSVPLHQGNLQDFVLHQPSEKPVIVVCYHGISSQNAAQFLVDQGFATVYSLDGGFTQWQAVFPELVTHDSDEG